MCDKVRVEFVKRWKRFTVGAKADVDKWLFDELKDQKIIKEYNGPWPPIEKTKINLKDLS
jgi:hypothetical protein